MRVCVFDKDGPRKIGLIADDKVLAIGPAGPLGVAEPLAVNITPCETYELSQIRLHCPIPFPPRIFGLGLNYIDHIKETGNKPPENQIWFMKQPTSANSPYGIIDKPFVSDMLDYEAELVVVIGKKCRHVPASISGEVIMGYCVGNDVSVRDWQMQTPTWNLGKGFDTHAPFGPWLVTPDEIENFDNLGIRCFVNGEKVQDAKLGQMHFKVPQMIEHLSKTMTLLPGDVIFTGTPSGVGMARKPQLWLKDGDVVRCEIDNIGHIENRVVNETKITVIE